MVQSVIKFGGREYTRQEARPLLMQETLNDGNDSARRQEAIMLLGALAADLRDTEDVELLIARFPRETDERCRFFLLQCLMLSGDRRALDLFAAVAREESELNVRLMALAALAHWNVRSGIDGLIEEMDNKSPVFGGKTAGDVAVMTIRHESERKGWGFPELVPLPTEALSPEAEDAWFQQQQDAWRQWFAANRTRFPEWPPSGPETPAKEAVSSGAHAAASDR